MLRAAKTKSPREAEILDMGQNVFCSSGHIFAFSVKTIKNIQYSRYYQKSKMTPKWEWDQLKCIVRKHYHLIQSVLKHS